MFENPLNPKKSHAGSKASEISLVKWIQANFLNHIYILLMYKQMSLKKPLF